MEKGRRGLEFCDFLFCFTLLLIYSFNKWLHCLNRILCPTQSFCWWSNLLLLWGLYNYHVLTYTFHPHESLWNQDSITYCIFLCLISDWSYNHSICLEEYGHRRRIKTFWNLSWCLCWIKLCPQWPNASDQPAISHLINSSVISPWWSEKYYCSDSCHYAVCFVFCEMVEYLKCPDNFNETFSNQHFKKRKSHTHAFTQCPSIILWNIPEHFIYKYLFLKSSHGSYVDLF